MQLSNLCMHDPMPPRETRTDTQSGGRRTWLAAGMPRGASVSSFCNWMAGARVAAALLHIQVETDGCTVNLPSPLCGAGPTPRDSNAVAEMPNNLDWPPGARIRPVCSALMHKSCSTIAKLQLWPPESAAMSLAPSDASCAREHLSRTNNVEEKHKCVRTTRTRADWCTFFGGTAAASCEHSQLTCGCPSSGSCGMGGSVWRVRAFARIFRRLE